MNLFVLPLFILFILWASCVAGSTDTSIFKKKFTGVTEVDFFQNIPVVTSASRFEQPLSTTPVSVTVITREQIIASGFVEIVDLLRLVPGFQVAHTDSRIFAATYHGQSDAFPGRLLVLVDGRSVYTPLLSTVDWSLLGIQIDDIERIEVIRGPNAPAYGSNAFNGTVNIVSRSPLMEKGGYVVYRRGEPGLNHVTASLNAGHPNFDYKITASQRQSDGYGYQEERTADVNDFLNINSFDFRSIYTPTVIDELEINFGIQSGTLGAKGENPIVDPPRDRRVKERSQSVRWRRSFSVSSDFTVQLYHNYYDTNDMFETPVNASQILGMTPEEFETFFSTEDQTMHLGGLTATTERYDIELKHTLIKRSGSKISWGGGYRIDSLKSPIFLDSGDIKKDKILRAFFNGLFRFGDNWLLNAGLLAEKGDIADPQYSPRLSFNYSKDAQQTWRISAAHASRTPSLLDISWKQNITFDNGFILNKIRAGNNNLKPETNHAYGLSYISEFPEKNLFVEVKLFKEKIRNGIDFTRSWSEDDPMPPTFVTINDTNIDIKGIEWQIKYTPSKRRFLSFQYSYTESYSTDIYKINPPDAPQPSVRVRSHEEATPKHTASLLAAYGFQNNIDVSTGIYYVDDMEWLGNGDAVPDYTRVDIRISKHLKINHYDARFSLIAQNIGGDYFEFENNLSFTRRIYLLVSISGR